VELRQDRADDATGLVILAAGKFGKRDPLYGTFQEDRILVMRDHARRTAPGPPFHEQAPDPLLVYKGYLEHGRHVAGAHRQKPAAAGKNRLAVRRQLPALQVIIEHG
jgi:hypothetical protein